MAQRVGSLGTRIVLSFVGFAVVLSAAFTFVSFAFLYTVEDTFIERALEEQAALSVTQYQDTGRFDAPEDPYMAIHTAFTTMPSDLRPQIEKNPQQIEFYGEEERHYHVMRLPVESPAWIVAEVSRILVIRPIQADILVFFAGVSLFMTLIACFVAIRLAWRSIAPLRRLAATVDETNPDALPTGFADQYPRNEIGTLADALQRAFDRIGGFVKREQDFTRDVSHDLRTPIAVVASSTELLQEPTADRERLLQSIRIANTHMERTVEALLALAREDSAAGPATPVPVAAAVERVVLQLVHGNSSVEVDVDVDPRATLNVREGVLEIILANVLGNSFQHAKDGVVSVKLDGTCLTVADRGGFEDEVKDQAFVEGVRGAEGGSGRGLSIVRRVCEHHGIAVELEHLDRGTAVHLRFP